MPDDAVKYNNNKQLRLFDNSMEERLLTIIELAEYLRVPVKTVRDWVYRRQMPYLKIGRHLRFRWSDIQAWLQTKEINHACI